MEFVVTNEEVPENSLLSVRVAGRRRTCPLRPHMRVEMPAAGPDELCEIDVWQVSGHAEVKAATDRVEIPTGREGDSLRVLPQLVKSGSAPGLSRAEMKRQERGGTAGSEKRKGDVRRDYMQEHRLPQLFQTMLRACLNFRPLEPEPFLIDLLRKRSPDGLKEAAMTERISSMSAELGTMLSDTQGTFLARKKLQDDLDRKRATCTQLERTLDETRVLLTRADRARADAGAALARSEKAGDESQAARAALQEQLAATSAELQAILARAEAAEELAAERAKPTLEHALADSEQRLSDTELRVAALQEDLRAATADRDAQVAALRASEAHAMALAQEVEDSAKLKAAAMAFFTASGEVFAPGSDVAERPARKESAQGETIPASSVFSASPRDEAQPAEAEAEVDVDAEAAGLAAAPTAADAVADAADAALPPSTAAPTVAGPEAELADAVADPADGGAEKVDGAEAAEAEKAEPLTAEKAEPLTAEAELEAEKAEPMEADAEADPADDTAAPVVADADES